MSKKALSAIIAIIILCITICAISLSSVSAKNNKLNNVSGFKATEVSSKSAKLTWDKVRGAKGYFIYSYSFKYNKWVRISIINSNSKLIYNLNPATKYVFAVKAYTFSHNNIVTSKSLAKAQAITYLKQIKGLKASAGWHNALLSWNKDASADGYIIFKRENNSWKVFKKLDSNTNKYNVSGLKMNSKYAFSVREYKIAANKKILSEKYTAVKVKTLAASVKGFKSVFAENKVRLNWKKVDKAKSYNIYCYDFASGKWELVANADALFWGITDLSTGTVYRYGIVPVMEGKAVNTEDMAKTEGKTLPGTVNYSVVRENGLLKFNWQELEEADKYIVYTKLPDKNWKREAVTTALSYKIKEPNAEKYYVTVNAVTFYKGKRLGGLYNKKYVQKKPYAYNLYSDGDSISYGTGSYGYSYAAIFAENHNMALTNNGVGGGTLASSVNGRYHIAESVIKNINDSYDYIFFDGGANDFACNAPLGKITAGTENQFDMNTTCGALESMLSYTKKTCKNSKIYFISVHKIYDDSKKNLLGLNYNAYRVAIESICRKYNVPVIDCYNNPFDFSYTFKKNGVFPKGDKIHPTEEGYKRFYMPVIEKAVIVD